MSPSRRRQKPVEPRPSSPPPGQGELPADEAVDRGELAGLDQGRRALGLQIMVVEDYPIQEQMIRKMLSYAGFDVMTAASGAIMDILIRDGVCPDMFILDLMLPGEDGVQIVRRLRQDPRFESTPVVLLSAYGLSRSEVRQLGFSGYIRKPMDMAKFTRAIKSYFPELT